MSRFQCFMFVKVNKGQIKMISSKNGHNLLNCYFNKTIKGPGSCWQSPALSQKHVRTFCHGTH